MSMIAVSRQGLDLDRQSVKYIDTSRGRALELAGSCGHRDRAFEGTPAGDCLRCRHVVRAVCCGASRLSPKTGSH